jgi:AcrR family transcriptional regulator
MPRPARRTDPALRERSAKPGKTGGSSAGSKPTQRDRILQAIIELTAKHGYQSVSIAQISSHARVSSATFYELFEGKEDCLLAAYRATAEQMFEQVRSQSAAGQDWRELAHTALTSLLGMLRESPDAGRMLFVEAAAGGPLIAEERRRVLGEFENFAQGFLDGLPSRGETLDVPPTAIVGALRSIISRRLRTNAEDELPPVVDDVITWLDSYRIPAGLTPWSTSPEALLPGAEKQQRKPAARARSRLPRGRHGLPAGVVARSQRTRLIYATAEVTMQKGYPNATVADIVAKAGVARDVFYEHFTDKQHAFLEAQQHPTQHIIDSCAAAYFSAKSWPERIWRGLGALLELIATNPEISYLRLIECYAAGPAAIRRAEEITRSFAIFLEEGYACGPQAAALPRLASEAITGALFEIIQRHVAKNDFAGLMPHLPQITYVAIAPFLGPRAAVEQIEALSAERVAQPA